MPFWRRCVKKTLPDEVTGGKAEVGKSVEGGITEKRMICCRHVRRVQEHCLPLDWSAIGSWRKGIPQQIWNEVITELMRAEGRERGLRNMYKVARKGNSMQGTLKWKETRQRRKKKQNFRFHGVNSYS
jgi:hypothetical protein